MRFLQTCFCLFLFFSNRPIDAEWKLIDGERLAYAAKWTGIPAGELVMVTAKVPRLGDDMYELRLEANTNSFWSMVYRVRDVIHSRVNVREERSHYYYKDVKQGRRHLEEKTTINYEGKKIIHSKQNLPANEKANLKEFPIEETQNQLFDPLSMIYGLRKIDFSKPMNTTSDLNNFNVFADKGVYNLAFRLGESEAIKLNNGEVREVWKIEPTAAYEGGIVDSGKLEIWLDKKTGIPLKLLFNIPVGWATLELNDSNHPDLKLEPQSFFRKRR